MSIQPELSQADFDQQKPTFLPDGDTIKWLVIPLIVLLSGLLYLSSVSDPNVIIFGIAGLVAAISAGILVWNHPEMCLLALIFLESDIILPDELVDVRLAVGGLDLRDMVLLGTLGLTFVKELINRRVSFQLFPIGVLLVLFLILAASSLINAIVFEKSAFNWAFNDFRIMLYYTLFFSVSWGVRTHKQLRAFLIGLYSLANFIVLLMIVQQFRGIDNLLTPGMSRWQIGEEAGGGLRILAPLILLIAVFIVITVCYAYFTDNRKYRNLAIIQSIFLIIGFLLTYTRSAWVTVAAALVIFLGYVAYQNQKKSATLLLLGSPLIISAVIFFTVVPTSTYNTIPLIGNVLERGVTIFEAEETTESDSLQWRFYENSEALRSIRERPIFGVGLGSQYREITIIQGEAAGTRTTDDITRLTRYVHNSFLSMAVKMGVPTLVFFIIIYVIFVGMTWHLHTQVNDPLYKSIVLGVAIAYIPCLFWAQFFSLFTESNHIASVAVFMGIIAVISRLQQENNPTDRVGGLIQ